MGTVEGPYSKVLPEATLGPGIDLGLGTEEGAVDLHYNHSSGFCPRDPGIFHFYVKLYLRRLPILRSPWSTSDHQQAKTLWWPLCPTARYDHCPLCLQGLSADTWPLPLQDPIVSILRICFLGPLLAPNMESILLGSSAFKRNERKWDEETLYKCGQGWGKLTRNGGAMRASNSGKRSPSLPWRGQGSVMTL